MPLGYDQSPRRKGNGASIRGFDAEDGGDSESSISFDEKKEQADLEFHQENLLGLMRDICMGYNPSNLPQHVRSMLHLLAEDVFPGSYKHLLIILFGSKRDMQLCQEYMKVCLDEDTEAQPPRPRSGMRAIDETLFASEVEMLRKLVAPLRGDERNPVFWLNSRTAHAEELCVQAEYTVEILEYFHHDLLADMVVRDEHGKSSREPRLTHADCLEPVYSKLEVGNKRENHWSLREHRLEAAADTLGWESLPKSGIEFTSFHQFYKSHLRCTDYRKAVKAGFTPPVANKFPTSILEGLPVSIPFWPSSRAESRILDLIYKTALWLALARGFPAVHLFCDMVRHFTLREPTRPISDERVCFLKGFSEIRISPQAVHIPKDDPPFPFDDNDLADRNPDYFNDVFESRRQIVEGLQENLSLIEKPPLPTDIPDVEFDVPPPNPRICTKRRNTISGVQPLETEMRNTASLQPKHPSYLHEIHANIDPNRSPMISSATLQLFSPGTLLPVKIHPPRQSRFRDETPATTTSLLTTTCPITMHGNELIPTS